MSQVMPSRPDDDEELLKRIIAEAGPPSVEIRSEFAASLHARVLERLGSPPRARRKAVRLLVGSSLAVLVVIAATLVFSLVRPVNLWAQVARALQGRPWIHSRTLGPEGKVAGESWFSPKLGIVATRHGEHVEYHDRTLHTVTRYVAAEATIYKVPERREHNSWDVDFYEQLLDPKGLTRSPVPGMEIVAQSRQDTVEGGQAWLDVALTLRVIGGDRVQQLQFRVDPRTKLPHSCVFDTIEGPKGTTLYYFPDHGPADIYELGAPRTAKLIDRIPGDDLDRMLTGLKVGRVRFDDYRGIMDWGDGMNAKRVWRKGRKWRVEQLLLLAKNSPEFPRGANEAWWKEHEGDFTPVVQAICDGEKVYYYRIEGDPYAPGAKEPPAVKLSSTQYINPSDDPFVPWPDMFPEQYGHPSVWQPAPDREFVLDPKPTDGPPGTILMRVRDTKLSDPKHPDIYKLWIDPAKNHLAMRSETSVFESTNPPKIAYVDNRVLEGLLQSPGGFWYASRIRRTTSNFNREQLWNYYLTFGTPLPDELFQPLKP